MKKLITLIVAIMISLILVNFQCNENIVEPPPEPPHPPGYQEDIPWPSLADSPWPMYHHDPQNTGRSKLLGPKLGLAESFFDSVHVETGVIITKDQSIVFQTGRPVFSKSGIYNVSSNGLLNWYQDFGDITSGCSPLVTKDDQIIASNFIGGKIFKYDQQGNLIWFFDTESYIVSHNLTIGLDGIIYFVDSTRTLFALNNNGTLSWKMKFENAQQQFTGYSGVAFSPDGKTLYINGANHSLYSINLITKTINWYFGNNSVVAPPLVDSDGNIYVCGKSISAERSSIHKLTSSGNIVWEQYWSDLRVPYFYSPTLDQNGNIYFGYRSLYSYDYSGNLRWTVDLQNNYGGHILAPLTCDSEGNVYVPLEVDLHKCKLVSFHSDGTFLFDSGIIDESVGDSPAIGNGILYLPTYTSEKIYLIH